MVNHNDLANDEQASAGPFLELIRLAVGFACVVAVAALLINTLGTADDAVAGGASSVQVTDIYAERSFYAIIAVGMLTAVSVRRRMWP